MYRHVNMRVETWPASGVGGEQALAESLELTQRLFKVCGEGMERAAAGVEGSAVAPAAVKAEGEGGGKEAEEQR